MSSQCALLIPFSPPFLQQSCSVTFYCELVLVSSELTVLKKMHDHNFIYLNLLKNELQIILLLNL